MEETKNPLDVAINGNGFLTVQAPGGERYTRDGNLQINNQGQLVTASGYPVLGTGGPIVFQQTDHDINITADGTITETSWVSNKLVFRQEALSAMAIRLERWYDVTIIFDNRRFSNDTLSGTFPQEPLADVMHALQITAGFHYRIGKDTVHIW